MNVHPLTSPARSAHMFDEIVCLRLEAGWSYIESGEQALACPSDRFNEHGEASWLRAYATCSSFVAGQASADAAKTTFIVAAMAAGIAFEVAQGLEVLERHVEEAATEGLITILFDEDERPTCSMEFRDQGA